MRRIQVNIYKALRIVTHVQKLLHKCHIKYTFSIYLVGNLLTQESPHINNYHFMQIAERLSFSRKCNLNIYEVTFIEKSIVSKHGNLI